MSKGIFVLMAIFATPSVFALEAQEAEYQSRSEFELRRGCVCEGSDNNTYVVADATQNTECQAMQDDIDAGNAPVHADDPTIEYTSCKWKIIAK